MVQFALAPVAASLTPVILHGVPAKGDVSNFLDAGNGAEELLLLVEAARAGDGVFDRLEAFREALSTVASEEADTGASWQAAGEAQIVAALAGTEEGRPALFLRDDGLPLIYPAKVNMFFGASESCKSWAALVVAAEELRKGNAVLYVDYEDSLREIAGRLVSLGVARELVLTGLLYVQPSDRFTRDAGLEILTDNIMRKDRTITLAVVDSVTEAFALGGLDPNVGKDVSAFYQGFPRWATRFLQASVILIDHVVKSGEGGRWPIGSERKISGIDGSALEFSLKANESFGRGRTSRIAVKKQRDKAGFLPGNRGSSLATLTLVSDASSGDVRASLRAITADEASKDVASEAARVAELKRKIVEVASEEPGLSTGALREKVAGDKLLFTVARDELVNSGVLRTERSGNAFAHFIS